MRLFLAVEAPPSARYGELAEALRTQWKARPVPTGSWHATLRFLGEVPDPQPVADAVRPLAAAAAPMPVEVRGVGAFPSPRKARVAWAAMLAPGLAELAAAIRAATPVQSDPDAGRAFHAHVTLARLDPPRDLSAFLEAHAGIAFASGTLREVGLFRSVTTPQGPVYTKLAALPLGGGPASPPLGSPAPAS